VMKSIGAFQSEELAHFLNAARSVSGECFIVVFFGCVVGFV
jgi:hypothetical protein